MIRDTLNGPLDFLNFGAVEGLCISGEGCATLATGRVLKEHEADALDAAGSCFENDVPRAMAFVCCYLSVSQNAVVQECQIPLVLVVIHSCKLRLSGHVKLQTNNVVYGVAGIGIDSRLDHVTEIIECELIFKSVAQSTVVK